MQPETEEGGASGTEESGLDSEEGRPSTETSTIRLPDIFVPFGKDVVRYVVALAKRLN